VNDKEIVKEYGKAGSTFNIYDALKEARADERAALTERVEKRFNELKDEPDPESDEVCIVLKDVERVKKEVLKAIDDIAGGEVQTTVREGMDGRTHSPLSLGTPNPAKKDMEGVDG
jgi:hypothetical protein